MWWHVDLPCAISRLFENLQIAYNVSVAPSGEYFLIKLVLSWRRLWCIRTCQMYLPDMYQMYQMYLPDVPDMYQMYLPDLILSTLTCLPSLCLTIKGPPLSPLQESWKSRAYIRFGFFLTNLSPCLVTSTKHFWVKSNLNIWNSFFFKQVSPSPTWSSSLSGMIMIIMI